jgi:ligand-binding sensor domain-containing protein/two-component sensor histidine kinase
MTKFRAVIFVLTLLSAKLNAQQYVFKQYTIDDGLAQSQVRAIAQGEKGYLWVGTASGLSRFNGREFFNYSTNDGLVDMQVNAIFKSKTKGMWVVTNKGITLFNDKKISQIDATSLVEGNNIFDADEDYENNLWLAVYKKGIVFLPKGNLKNAKTFDLPDNSVGSVFVSKNKDVLAWGSAIPLYVFNTIKKGFEPVIYDNEEVLIKDVFQYSKDSLFILSENDVFLFSNKKLIPLTNNYSMPKSLVISSMFVDNDKSIWLSTKQGTYRLRDNGTTTHFNKNNGLPFEDAKIVFQDKEDNIWIGTDGGGLLKFYSKQEFVTFKKADGLPSEQIMSIVQRGKEIWFSTYTEGVFKKEGENYYHYTTNNGLPNNTVWASAIDKTGNIWLGTSSGLSKFNGKRFENFFIEDGLPSDRVTALFEDKQSRLWIGCKDGIAIYQNEKFTSIQDTLGFYGYRTRSIKQDQNGTIWLGCKNGVYKTTSGKEFELVLDVDSIALNSEIYSIEISDENLFIGTSTGLFLFNIASKEITPIQLSKKYFSNSVNFFIADPNQENAYWAGRNDGLYFLSVDFDENNTLTKFSTKRFSTYNGIENLETNQNSAFFDNNGALWFGTGMGLVKKADNNPPTNTSDYEPVLTINSILLFLEPLSNYPNIKTNDTTGLPNNLKLTYNQNHVTLNYEAISLSNPDGFVYRYKLLGLDGFEEEWSPPTKSTSATFSNLSYGSYTFQVEVSSIEDQSWSTPIVFNFVITPPFWLTTWFILLCSISFVLFVFAVYKWRTQVNKRKRETEQVMFKNKLLDLEQQSLNSSMNRHFIFNALNSIQFYINTQDRLSANKYLTSFAKLIRKNLESTNAHNNLTTLKDELDRIKLYLSLEAMRFPDKVTYEIDVSEELNTDNISVPPMFFQPFIENSIWHGILPKEKGHIQISIHPIAKGEKLSILIEDDGVGISASSKNKQTSNHDSRGVEITKRRIELLEKYIHKKIEVFGPEDILNQQGDVVGTRVEIIFPLKNET